MSDPMDEGAVEAGRILARTETPRERAVRLLRELVPDFKDRDEAIQHLYYIEPEKNRLYSIAAALYILGTDLKRSISGPLCRRCGEPLGDVNR